MDNEKKQDVRYSLSDIDEEPKAYGNYNIYGNDISLHDDPFYSYIRENGNINASVPKKETPPKEKSAKEKKIEELNRLNRLLYERDQEFEKAKGKRTILTIVAFTVAYFIIICMIDAPSSLEGFAGALVGAAFFAGLHFWINSVIFIQLCQKGREESEILDSIRNRIREIEKSDPH